MQYTDYVFGIRMWGSEYICSVQSYARQLWGIADQS